MALPPPRDRPPSTARPKRPGRRPRTAPGRSPIIWAVEPGQTTPPERVPHAPRYAGRGGAGVRLLALAVAVAAGLSAPLLVGDAPPAPPPPTQPAPAEAEGAWIQLVGSAPTEPAPAGWSVQAPDAEPTALVGPDADGTGRFWEPALPPALQAVGRRLRVDGGLAQAGGEVFLAGGRLPSQLATASSAPSLRVTVTLPPAVAVAARTAGALWVDGVDYADPVGVGLPLLRTGGFEAQHVSASFTVADFATRDGAPYARIAPDLVSGLEAMRAELGPLTVISGYRHPSYNALPTVGGAWTSRHQSGQAADVWSPTETAVSIALAAVRTMGCGIGLGLGRNTVHVDVRGYLSTWTYPGAPLSERAFDRWIGSLCGDAGAAPRSPAQAPGWVPIVGDGGVDEEEVIHTSEAAVAAAVSEAPAPEAVALDVRVRRDLGPFAAAAYGREGLGVVVVDLRDGDGGGGLADRTHYAAAGAPEAQQLRVGGLLQWVGGQEPGRFFVYAVHLSSGRLVTGVAPIGALAQPAPAAPAPPERWFAVVALAETLRGAADSLVVYEPALRAAGLGTAVHAGPGGEAGRYRLLTGPFGSADDAARAAAQADVLGPEVEVIRLD